MKQIMRAIIRTATFSTTTNPIRMKTNPESDVIPFPTKPRILTRSEHNISRDNISSAALKVLYRLKQADYQAYLVGGGVRDLLLGREPKDFDIATDAQPEQVRELFRNCRLIGRRFRLAHVHFGQEIIEVATFRADAADEGDRVISDGMILRDNVYGSLDDDVWRRDFTVNALYYNIEDFSVVDYVNGVEDVKAGRLRLIGDPEERYREDPVRMLRAVRFATKLGFTIDKTSEAPIFELGQLLKDIPAARLLEETNKLFMSGYALQSFEQLRHMGLFNYLFPQVEESLAKQEGGFPHTLIMKALENTDARINIGKPVNPAFLFSVMLWQPMNDLREHYLKNGASPFDAERLAADTVISRQIATVAIPRRLTTMIREIWALQSRLLQRQGKRPFALLANKRFRAAYDFLLLRSQAGEVETELADWWTEFQDANDDRREAMQSQLPTDPGRKRKRRPRRRKPRSKASD